MYCTVEGELEIAATVWVQLCAYVGVGVWIDVCVCVCVRGYACASFILLLTEEPAASSLTISGAVFHATASHFTCIVLQSSSPAHSPSPPSSPASSSSSISPCSEVERGSFSIWLGCTGVLWATLIRPLSVTAVPFACVHIYTIVLGLWGSPTH